MDNYHLESRGDLNVTKFMKKLMNLVLDKLKQKCPWDIEERFKKADKYESLKRKGGN